MFSANGKIEFFANATDAGESAQSELPHQNQHCLPFSCQKKMFQNSLLHDKWSRSILNKEDFTLGYSALKELRSMTTKFHPKKDCV